MSPVPIVQKESLRSTFVGLTISFSLSVIVVALRLWARSIKKVKLGWSDWATLVALASLLTLQYTVAVADYCLWTYGITLIAGISPGTEEFNYASFYRYGMLAYIDYWLWATSVTASKVSILLLYRTIFYCHKRFLWATNVVIVLCAIFLLVHCIGLLAICDPIEFEWNRTIKDGNCGFNPGLAFLSSTYNAVLDVTLVIIPAPIVWRLQLPVIKKVSVSAMFAVGIGICSLVIVRFIRLTTFGADLMAWNFNDEGQIIITKLEIDFSIISACLPLISPPLVLMYTWISRSFPLKRLLGCISERLLVAWTRLTNGFRRASSSRDVEGSENTKAAPAPGTKITETKIDDNDVMRPPDSLNVRNDSDQRLYFAQFGTSLDMSEDFVASGMSSTQSSDLEAAGSGM